MSVLVKSLLTNIVMWQFLLFFIVFFTPASFTNDSRIVDTEQGPVRGYKDVDGGLFAFYNIPYAKAPTGRYRFKAPLAAKLRTEVFEAVDNAIVCPQMNFITEALQRNVVTTEDCLVANIFVPDTETDNLPVIVYVHGGGFVLGYGNYLTYKNLITSNEVIVVTFNYRLGPHGFLCLGTEDIPGNAGMKDQVALLRWVQSNIGNFGGNRSDVTIAGYSAGSGSVELLMLSEMANGLFSKVIPESGSCLSFWAVQNDPINVAKSYARKLGFEHIDDLNALEEFYKTLSYEILSSELSLNTTDTSLQFSPCIERETNYEPFLTDSPINILKSGNYIKTPMLFGFAEKEGLMRVPVFEQWKDKMNNNFTEFLPPDLYFESEAKRHLFAMNIRKFYFGDAVVNEDNILSYVDFFSDTVITYSTLRSVRLHKEAGHNNIYLYVYSYADNDSPIIPHTENRGATHCAQSSAIGDGNLTYTSDDNLSHEYKGVKETLRVLWANFVRTGKPVPDDSDLPAWPTVRNGWSPYMKIDKNMKIEHSLLEESVKFWDQIYDKYYRPPSPPPPPPYIRTEL